MLNFLLLFPSFVFSQPLLLPTQYIALMQEKINSYTIYPLEAKNKGWEGVVKVKFTLMSNGQIKGLDIAKSSGYPQLDEAAMSAVKKASPYPYPSLSSKFDNEGIELVVPINYENPNPKPALPPTSEVSPLPSAVEVSPPTTAQKEESAPLEELEKFIALAQKNNQPTKVAQEEIELAQLKVRESQRNLFPALKVECYNTEGEVYKINYEERETKVQLDQPIYYGGRLGDSINQAKTNLEINQKNFDRLKIDVSHKAEVAYYNLVGSRMNLKTQEIIREEAKKILEIVQKQASADLVTPMEISGAQSWYEQINFQLDSTKQDMAMAELTFMQVLNTSEPPAITQEELEIKKFDLPLNAYLETGLKNRPEIYLSKLLVRFNEYGKKIERAKDKFTVDFTSSYGRYEGAYKTESMRTSDNWYIGFKATKPFGANTVNTLFTNEETQPRFGQTSATKSSTIKAEFNLLDNLGRLSDKKKAEIELQRSLSDLNETTKTINFEIKDAYLNYQKALLQAATAQSETKFRKQEVEVLKVRAQVGEIDFSNVMEALVNLSRSQTSYTQALANYYISLANLKKASGYGITSVNLNKI